MTKKVFVSIALGVFALLGANGARAQAPAGSATSGGYVLVLEKTQAANLVVVDSVSLNVVARVPVGKIRMRLWLPTTERSPTFRITSAAPATPLHGSI